MGGRPRFLGLDLGSGELSSSSKGACRVSSHSSVGTSVEIVGESLGGGSSKLEVWLLGRPLFRAGVTGHLEAGGLGSELGRLCFGDGGLVAEERGEELVVKGLEGVGRDSSVCCIVAFVGREVLGFWGKICKGLWWESGEGSWLSAL